jgi:SAM-dependent methyltransferase
MSFDADAHRDASRRQWQDAASGWIGRQELIREWGAAVSHWMVDAIHPHPGQRVLELAAGVGETGLLVAELVAPSGKVIISDQAEAMLDGARARAAALGIANVEFRVLHAEGIDLPLASVDAVLCRWGYMLLADPAAALAETRRVLRPGGRVALAVWDSIEQNPWASLTTMELSERGLVSTPAAGTPGPFTLGDPERVRTLLEEAGFVGVRIEAIDVPRRQASLDEFWESQLDLSPSLLQALQPLPEQEVAEIRAGVALRLAPYLQPDGSMTIPGRSLVAAASA